MLYRYVADEPASHEEVTVASMRSAPRRNCQLPRRQRCVQHVSAQVALMVVTAIFALSSFGVTIANGSTSGSFEWETFEKGVFTVYYATFADTADSVVTNSSTNFMMNFLDLESNSANPCGTLAYSTTRDMPPFWSILYPNATAPWHPDGSQDSQYPSKTPANDGDSVLMYWDAGANGWYWCTKPGGNARVFPQISTDPNAFDTSLQLNFIALSETPIGCQLPSSEDGYEIASANDLAQIGNPCDTSATYQITDEIDLSQTNLPVVTSTFTGTLRGAGDTAVLANLTHDVTSGDVALFKEVNGATFSDFTIRNASFTSSATSQVERIAFLVASGTNVTFRNLSVTDSTMDLTKTTKVGSLAGELKAPLHVENVSLNGVAISSTDPSFPYGGPTGGVIGRIIPSDAGSQTVSIVDITIDAASSVSTTLKGGGIVGALEHTDLIVTIERADVQGDLIGAGTSGLTAGPVGGLVGFSRVASLEIHESAFSGDIRATPESGQGFWRSGGMIGEANRGNTLLRRVEVSTTIDVSGTDRPDDQTGIGGLIGYFASGSSESLTVEESFVTGSIVTDASGSEANGGIVGEVWGAVTILNSGAKLNVSRGGGLIGKTNRAITITNAYAAGSSTGGLIAVDNGPSITAPNAFWDTTVGAQTTASNVGKGRATSQMQDVTTFVNAGWAIASCIGNECAGNTDSPVWAIRPNEYPILCALEDDLTCSAGGSADSSAAAVAVTEADGNELTTQRLRNLPFDVRVTLVDANGDPVDNATEPATVTLVAAGGGTPGELKFAFEEPATPVTLTLPIGESSIVFENVIFTGLSAEDAMGDVTLTASIEGGSGDGFTVETPGMSFRDIAMTVTSVASELPADGVSTTQLTVELTDADGEPQAGQTIRMTTTLGTLHAGTDATGSGAQDVSTETNANGIATFTLRAAIEAGIATVTAFCPGACPVATTVTFIGAIEGLTPIPGNERGWIAFNAPPGVESLETEIRESGTSTEPTLRTVQASEPVRLDGLANGKAVDVRLRAIFDEKRRGPWSETVTFTPSEEAEAPVGAPSFETLADRITLEPDPDGNANAGTFTVTLRASNDTDAAIQNAWLQALDVPDHVQIVSLEASTGTIERLMIEDRENWFWRNANLEPTQDDTPIDALATITVTLRVEVK